MEWRRYLRLSYAETQDFSERRSLVGIALIVLICVLAGSISLYANGKLRTCDAAYDTSFSKGAQVEEGKAGCQGATLSVGQLLFGYSFTYAVTQSPLEQYRDEDVLTCNVKSRGATINLLSFAAPQFLWAYQISCSRPPDCCPEGIRGTPSEKTSCFCDQTLELHIQDFSSGNYSQAYALVNGNTKNYPANYSNLNGTLSNIQVRQCPLDNSTITVLRFDDTTYSAFSASAICSGVDKSGAGAAPFQDASIAAAMQNIRDYVDLAVAADLRFPALTVEMGVTYLCYTCSSTHDIGQILLDFLVAVSAIGSVTYSLVLWVLKLTHRDKSPSIQLGDVNSL